jgi:2-desacetyl-2-hydroxyethyl bacteriochlorophyllide A dehydrogenase
MKAVLYEGPGAMKVVDLPKPVAGAGEVVVKVTMCGICGTDTHSYMHEGILFPGTVFGHETVGVVDAIGPGVEGYSVGDRVAVGAPGSCPEGCYYCRIGRPTLCVNGFGRTLGIGPGTQGAYAEYILAKYPNRMLIKIPDAVGDDQAVLFDIFSTAFHGFKRSSFKAGMNVVVVGAGAIGLSMVQLLKLAGAGHITAVNRALKKREMALGFGADLALSPSEETDLVGKVKALYSGLGADIVYECAGNPATVGLSVQLARAGGEVILIGTNPEPLATINEIQLGLFELDLKGSFAYDEEEIRTVLRFMEKGLITTEGMLNKKFKLEDAAIALEELSRTTEPVRYALVP